ncbi:hypothetical protein [Undibacterium terreum]|uniref:Uncharacterized protein n=1 Tax=Undibacterium terreum TaxID=1224302 RepID=A0A916UMB4_9BURK|nr:hypothetical protein [Undibacterium terreum]GGC78858.1 hypothetical protein GCM10011396_27570 [Undibacterium terreum]
MPNKIRFAIALLFTGLSLAAAADEVPKLSSTAKDFVSKGALQVLKACDLPKGVCGKSRFTVTSESGGESNDAKGVTRQMRLDGLELEMNYPVTNPRKFYLSQVSLSGGQWKIPRGLDLGSNTAKVKSVLGQPSYLNDDCYEYVYEEKQSGASLCFKEDKLIKIVWDQFID